MQAMDLHPAQAFDDACYLALQAHDARFDGSFFTGVTSTGVYCRPVCRVRTPKRENCRFFAHAAQAERAGFRPCLRCRPELAPGHARIGTGDAPWSTQDASAILAQQAAQRLDQPQLWLNATPGIGALAQRLGISDRHLRRIFEAHYGVSPMQYLQTRRLLCAKQLLADTRLTVAQIAGMSGFASVRRFNAVFATHYGLQPSQLRSAAVPGARAPDASGIQVRLGYRPPYDADAMLQFLGLRQIGGMEQVTHTPLLQRIARTLRIRLADQELLGWLLADFEPDRCQVKLRVSDSLAGALPQVMAAVRSWLDLDADPATINRQLHADFPDGDGLRLPGTVDGFELAVRAVLGQQITVAAARTLCGRLVERFGEPLATPHVGLNRLFPSAHRLARAPLDTLGELGIVKQRQAAIQALARAVDTHGLRLDAGADLTSTLAALQALPGIGDWTAQYIAMRALAWPDAFPAGDVALQKALGVRGASQPARAALAAAQAWRPWRSYAVIRAWTAPAPARAGHACVMPARASRHNQPNNAKAHPHETS